MIGEKQPLKKVSFYWTGKRSVNGLSIENYISTENLVPNKGGVVASSYLPLSGKVNSFSIGDILISNIRPYFKKIWHATKDGGCSNDVLVFRALNNKVNNRFLYYALSQDSFFNYMVAGSNGTKMPRGNKTSIMEFKINVPPYPIQQRIADILSAYDNLIKNNLRRIQLLEEAARCRYKLMMEDSNLQKESHEVGSLLMKVKKRESVRREHYLEHGKYPIIDQGATFIGGYTDKVEHLYSNFHPVIVFGDHTRVLKFVDFPFATGADGTQLVKPENPALPTSFLYFALLESNLSNYHYARHFKFLKTLIIDIPSFEELAVFDQIVEPYFRLRTTLMKKNVKLQQARDLLLPRLMSGEISLNSTIDETLQNAVTADLELQSEII